VLSRTIKDSIYLRTHCCFDRLIGPIYIFIFYIFQRSILVCSLTQWLVAGLPSRRPGFDIRSYGICSGQSGTGGGGGCFLRVLQFHLPFLIPPTASHSIIIILSTLTTSLNKQLKHRKFILTLSSQILLGPSIVPFQYVFKIKSCIWHLCFAPRTS
jgi:hypothetical protein